MHQSQFTLCDSVKHVTGDTHRQKFGTGKQRAARRAALFAQQLCAERSVGLTTQESRDLDIVLAVIGIGQIVEIGFLLACACGDAIADPFGNG